jgi:hypothetical protein
MSSNRAGASDHTEGTNFRLKAIPFQENWLPKNVITTKTRLMPISQFGRRETLRWL